LNNTFIKLKFLPVGEALNMKHNSSGSEKPKGDIGDALHIYIIDLLVIITGGK